MKNYKGIHIWEFNPTLTFIGLKEDFRRILFNKLKNNHNSTRDLLNKINKSSKKYNLKRNYNTGHLSSWIKGSKKDRRPIQGWFDN